MYANDLQENGQDNKKQHTTEVFLRVTTKMVARYCYLIPYLLTTNPGKDRTLQKMFRRAARNGGRFFFKRIWLALYKAEAQEK